MVGHQAPGPDLTLRLGGGLKDQVFVSSVIVLLEENGFSAVPALGDVMRKSRDDDTGDASHAAQFSVMPKLVNCHRNL